MARPPIKVRPRTPDKMPGKSNRRAIIDNQDIVDGQLPEEDSADHAVAPPPRPGAVMEEARTGERSEGMPSHEPGYNVGAEEDRTAWAADTPGVMRDTAGGAYRETTTVEERHEKRLGWLYGEMSRQAPNRREMARDEGFYDSKQWEREDDAIVRDRGQRPVVYNEVKPTIDFLIGTERRSRVDFYVVAEEADDPSAPPGTTQPSDDALNKTKAMKYLDDVNRAEFERSAAADSAFKAGMGILEVGLRGDKSGVPILIEAESWRNCWHDSRAKRDMSDARYFFRVKELDLDVAIAAFPKHEEALRAEATAADNSTAFRGLHGLTGPLSVGSFDDDLASGTDDGYGTTIDLLNSRERVTVIECWSREPVKRALDDAGLGDPIEFRIRLALMTETITLHEQWSPFKHDRFPFILVWAYRDAATGMPYSPIRPLRGPQEGLNRKMTRAIYESSFNQMEMEKSAIDVETMDIDELQTEANDPTGVLVFADGALSGQKVRQRTNPGAMREQVMLAEGDRQTLRQISSVNEENRGLHSQATSRVAMDAKAERGSIGTAELFDEQLRARQQEGEMTLSLIEQFWTEPSTIRVAGEGSRFEHVSINQPQADGSFANDITQRRSHFVVGEQAWKQSYAESAFASLMDVLTQLASSTPQIVVGLLDVVFDMHPNLPRKKTVIERIRAINGQSDPDGKMTPEQAAAKQKAAQMAEMQFQLQMAQLKADVAGAQAKGNKLDTDAMLVRVTALYEAAQAAQVLALAPAITPIADQLLASAGFQDAAGSPQTIVPMPQPAQPVEEQTAVGPQSRMQALAQGMPEPGAELQQTDGAAVGAQAGIRTAAADGVQQ